MQVKNFSEYLRTLGLKEGQHILVHSGLKKIISAFPESSSTKIIKSLQQIVTADGSLIFPTFTYCYKTTEGDYEIFDRENSPSKVGVLSEVFRKNENVIRTSSPTHSFALWGEAARECYETNSPASPLGEDSICDWMTRKINSFVLLLGVDFKSLSYGHYLEIAAKIPWYDFSPWEFMKVLPIGVSIHEEQKLKELPGCSAGFIHFQKYLQEKNLMQPLEFNGLISFLIPIALLYSSGVSYFKANYENILCPQGECQACDSRRQKFILSK